MKREVVAVALAAGLVVAGCASIKEPLHNDAWSQGRKIETGLHGLRPGRSLEIGEDTAIYREPGRGVVITAEQPVAVEPSAYTRGLAGGLRYRIRSVDCLDSEVACEALKSAIDLYVTSGHVERTPLRPGGQSRSFDGVHIAVTGGKMGFAGGFERTPR